MEVEALLDALFDTLQPLLEALNALAEIEADNFLPDSW